MVSELPEPEHTEPVQHEFCASATSRRHASARNKANTRTSFDIWKGRRRPTEQTEQASPTRHVERIAHQSCLLRLRLVHVTPGPGCARGQ